MVLHISVSNIGNWKIQAKLRKVLKNDALSINQCSQYKVSQLYDQCVKLVLKSYTLYLKHCKLGNKFLLKIYLCVKIIKEYSYSQTLWQISQYTQFL